MILGIVLLACNSLQSQVIIIPETPASGIIMKQQVWTLVINNLSGSVKKAALYVTITDRTNSQILVEANSGLLNINTGVKRITYQDLLPVNYAVAAAGFSDERQLNQPLPVGEYLICYRLFEIEATVNETLASECIKVYAEPLSPPQLIQPENASVINEIRPVLSWTPPAPVYMFNTLSYDIIVSPLYEKQSPQEALQRNIPVMTTGTVSNSLLYPSSFTNLEQGKTYVWQVVAKDAGRFGGKSEVWTFTIMPDSVASLISSAPYIKLSRQNIGMTIVHQGILKMEYINSSRDSAVHVSISKLNEKGKNKPFIVSLRLGAGQNFLEYNLNGKLRLDESAVYEVKLLNGRKEEWGMKFNPKQYF